MRGTEVDPAAGGASAEMLTSLYSQLRRIAAAQMSRSSSQRRRSNPLRWFTKPGSV